MYCHFDAILTKLRMFMLNSGEEHVGHGPMEMETYFVKLNQQYLFNISHLLEWLKVSFSFLDMIACGFADVT